MLSHVFRRARLLHDALLVGSKVAMISKELISRQDRGHRVEEVR